MYFYSTLVVLIKWTLGAFALDIQNHRVCQNYIILRGHMGQQIGDAVKKPCIYPNSSALNPILKLSLISVHLMPRNQSQCDGDHQILLFKFRMNSQKGLKFKMDEASSNQR